MSRISVLHREHLEAFAFVPNRTTRFCVAHIIEVLQRWTKFKLKRREEPWIYMPIIRQPREVDGKKPTSWHQELLGQFGKDAIREALTLLQRLGIVLRRKNPYNGQDRTFHYYLNPVRLEEVKSAPPNLEAIAFSEDAISPSKGDCTPQPQISTPISDPIERSTAHAQKNLEEEQVKPLETPVLSSVLPGVLEIAPLVPKVASGDTCAAAGDRLIFFFKRIVWSQFQAPPPDEDSLLAQFFEWVVRSKVPKLREPPADPYSAAESWIQKRGGALVTGFIRWKQAESRQVLAVPQLMPKATECARSPAQILAQWQQQWADPHLQRGIRQSVRDNPALGLEIGDAGPRWKVRHE